MWDAALSDTLNDLDLRNWEISWTDLGKLQILEKARKNLGNNWKRFAKNKSETRIAFGISIKFGMGQNQKGYKIKWEKIFIFTGITMEFGMEQELAIH